MMQRRIQLAAAVAIVAIASVVATTALAQDDGTDIRENLAGFQEVPAVSTDAAGRFTAELSNNRITYELRYEDLEGDPTQAHIHLGQRNVNGGISVWLCGNPNPPVVVPPPGTPECPPAPATVTGEITRDDVVGPTAQGIEAGQFGELRRAIRNGVTYANVHSSRFGGGEIRGQLLDD